MTDDPVRVVVMQEDRDARNVLCERIATFIRNQGPLGSLNTDIDQLLARHRTQAIAAERERCARKCLQVSGLIGAAVGSSIDSALLEAAAAIRQEAL